MTNNDFSSAASNLRFFDDDGIETLPLLTKERTQRFELLLHLIPNLKQHLIVSGPPGIGKTLLLDMLYDLDSDAWQCCFVQGSAELSFETIEAQLTKTMLRNKHISLKSALHNFQEQHKKIVLIIDDAGLLVSGLMTILIEYATTQPALKLIFSLTPEARQNHRKTDKALDSCYLLEIPTLNKQQCANFLRHLAAKPRTYSALPIDEKLLEKIYQDTQGIPARIINDFTKLARENQNDYSKWLIAFAGLVILAIAINQSVRYFKKESVENNAPILPIEPIEKIEKTIVKETQPISTESQIKTDEDIIIPEFKLDIEKGVVSTPTTENSNVEKSIEPNPAPVVESEKITEPEKVIAPIQAPPESEKIEPIVDVVPQIEKTPESALVSQPEKSTPTVVIEPEKSLVSPVISFPKIEPAEGMKIQALPEKSAIQAMPIAAPEVKKVEIKPVEKPVEIKKPESPKIEPVKKVEPKSEKDKTEKVETIVPPATGRYALQLITLSSEAAVEAFQKKHPTLNKNTRVVKSGSEEQPRFALMYGGFMNADEATKSREHLPSEFAGALPRKLNP